MTLLPVSSQHLTPGPNGPAVYVGTYAKYNSGSIRGAWLNLEDYADHDGFIEACKALHSDETDPELMFQDYQSFPSAYYGESYIKPDVWEWLELDASDRTLLAAYQAGVYAEGGIEEARDNFMATGDTRADIAETYFEETGGLEGCPEFLRSHINWDSVARDLSYGDVTFVRHEGTVYAFHN